MANMESNGDKLTKKEEADLYLKLAESAQDRFHSRRETEWKVTVALWTLFAASTAAAITARVWHPTWIALMGLGLVIAVIVFFYWYIWLRYLAEAFRRDQRVSYHWESAVQDMLEVKIPKRLEPPFANTDSPSSPDTSESGLHKSQCFQFAITLLFALLLFWLMMDSGVVVRKDP